MAQAKTPPETPQPNQDVAAAIDTIVSAEAGNITPEQVQALEAKLQEIQTTRQRTDSTLAIPNQPIESASSITPEEAKKLFGDRFMGSDQIKRALGFHPDQIPSIGFSREVLERLAKKGGVLQQYVAKTPDKTPLTMQSMSSMQQESGRNNRVLYNNDWYQNEPFYYTQDTPRSAWRVDFNELLPDSTSKNIVEQLELITQALGDIFEDMDMPTNYQQAISEFETQKAQINELMKGYSWKQASEMIENLSLSKLTLRSPAELIYAGEMHHQNNPDQYLFPNTYVRTPCRGSDGGLVDVGGADALGLDVGGNHPGDRDGHLGVSLSLQS